MQRKLGYQYTAGVKLIRRNHMVGISVHVLARDLRTALYNVPDYALVDEVVVDDDLFTIEFREEIIREG